MLNCPECNKELLWITDNEDDEQITKEYYCYDCSIDVIKHYEKELSIHIEI